MSKEVQDAVPWEPAGHLVRLLAGLMDVSLAGGLALVAWRFLLPLEQAEGWQALLQLRETAAATEANLSTLIMKELSQENEALIELVALAHAIAMIVTWLYFWISSCLGQGASLGQSVFALRVIAEDEPAEPSCPPLRLAMRAGFKTLCLLVQWFWILIAILFVNARRKTAYDFITRTRLVRALQPNPSIAPHDSAD